MNTLTRRNLFLAASGTVAGTLIGNSAAQAEAVNDSHLASGLVTGQPKPLRYKSIPGFLSEAQIAPHHTAHYGGALRGYSAAEEKLQTSINSDTTIDTNLYGALQRARATKGNSVLLHELYFDGLAFTGNTPAAETRRAIEARFGSIDKWAEDFQACAKAAAGWAMLAYHSVNGKLYNMVSDEHAVGPFWMSTPLVVIDVYEHAFYVDYTNRKAEYIEQFMNHIDWQVVADRIQTANQSSQGGILCKSV